MRAAIAYHDSRDGPDIPGGPRRGGFPWLRKLATGGLLGSSQHNDTPGRRIQSTRQPRKVQAWRHAPTLLPATVPGDFMGPRGLRGGMQQLTHPATRHIEDREVHRGGRRQ